VKVSIVLSSFKDKETLITALIYAAFMTISAKNEANLILLNDGVKYAEKDYINKVYIDEKIKKTFYYQSSIDLSKIKNALEFIRYLKKNFNFNVKLCNTSAILYGISETLASKEKISEEFEPTTIYDIYITIRTSDLCIYL